MYDKTLKLISDLLHIKDAAILTREEGEFCVEQSTDHTVIPNIILPIDGVLQTVVSEKKAKVINSNELDNELLIGRLNFPSFIYLFPCLDSQHELSAMLLLSLGKSSNFDQDRFSLIHVVGQRLAVELEKNKVSKEKDELFQFNQAVKFSVGLKTGCVTEYFLVVINRIQAIRVF